MATLNINGQRVKVDDSFLQMSPEQQEATVNEIAGSIGSQQSQQETPEEKTFGGAGMTWMENAINGIPIVGPSIQKGSDFVGSNLYGLATGQDPAQIREGVNNRREGRNEAYPASALSGSVAGGIAGTAPMVMAAPAAFGAGGGNLLARSLASGATGMALGGTDAAIRSDFNADAIKLGAGAGLVLGGVGPAVGQAIGAAARKVGDVLASRAAAKSVNMSPSALRYLNKTAKADGLDADIIQQRFADFGPDAMLMDISPNMRGAAGALANHPGEAQTIIRDALTQRQVGANQRIVAGLDDALGSSVNPRAVNEAIREGQRAVGPAYAEAFKGAQSVDTSHIADALELQALSLRGDAQKAARDVRKMLNVANNDALDTNPYTLFQTRNAIDGKLAGETNPKAIEVYTNARKQVDDMLASNVPGIKMADAQFQELARQNEGLRTGLKALDSGREALRPDELRQAIIEGVNPEGLMVGPSGNTFRMQQAARADIDRQVGTKANDIVALKNVLKGEGDWNRDRIGMLFGQERADRAIGLLDREARFTNTNNDVTGNSFTKARDAAQKDLFPAAAPAFGTKEAFAAGGLSGAARSAGTRAIDRLIGVLIDRGTDTRNVGIADALAGSRQAVINALSQMQKQKDFSPEIRKLIQVMMMERGAKTGDSARDLLPRF